MSINTIIEEAEKLSSPEREQLLQALVKMVDDRNGDLTPAQHADLLRRIEEANANPDDFRPWEEVRAELRKEFLNAPTEDDPSSRA